MPKTLLSFFKRDASSGGATSDAKRKAGSAAGGSSSDASGDGSGSNKRPRTQATSSTAASSTSSSTSSSSAAGNANVLSLASITDPGWRSVLAAEEQKSYFKSLRTFVDRAYATKIVYPPRADIFAAFNDTPWEAVRVVVIGQDPYHGAGQAHGLCFSVRRNNRVPPSLRNVYKELAADIPGFTKPTHGFLSEWAKQGVLLLNTVLTVQKATAYSHRKKGWEKFTAAAIRKLAREREGLVFLCWGSGAHKLADECGVSPRKHLVLKSSHPSPLGATKTKSPFIGSRCFSKANAYLKKNGMDEIDWQVSETAGK